MFMIIIVLVNLRRARAGGFKCRRRGLYIENREVMAIHGGRHRLVSRVRSSRYGRVKKTAEKLKRVLDPTDRQAYNSTPDHGARHYQVALW